MNLSFDQANALNEIEQWLNDDTASNAYVLTGSAGTGKTTIIENLLHHMPLLTAMTHRAAAVLKDKLAQETFTAHKAFGLAPTISKYGKETYKFTGRGIVCDGIFIIVDEASMIGNNLLQILAKSVKQHRAKILFVGDPYQLPPVKERCSIFDGSLPTAKLTTIHRQAAHSPIIAKADEFRCFIDGTSDYFPQITESLLDHNGNGIHYMNEGDFNKKFIKKYINYTAGEEIDFPLCTYTNASANEYNERMRKSLFFMGNDYQPYYPGELMVSNSAVIRNDKIILSSNEPVIIDSFKPLKKDDIFYYHIQFTRIQTLRNQNPKDSVLVPVNREDVANHKKQLKGVAVQLQYQINKLKRENSPVPNKLDKERIEAWRTYYNFDQEIGDLRPPFAGTTHKAQGGTFHSVFIDGINLVSCRDPKMKARLMYVALTRAQNDVYFYGEK